MNAAAVQRRAGWPEATVAGLRKLVQPAAEPRTAEQSMAQTVIVIAAIEERTDFTAAIKVLKLRSAMV